MVSELVLLRPASVPTNDGFSVRVGPRRKKESLISDLKNFIELRFNSPSPQVFVGEDGGVVITGLYEGIPDDADYNHEIFDHILDLVGWIEGCVELPLASEEKGSDHDQLTKEVSMNEPLVVQIGSTLKSDEGLGQNEAKISPTLMKESSCFGARHMLDEMPEPVVDLKTIEVSDLSDARPILTVNKEFDGSIKGLEELSVHDDLGFDPGGVKVAYVYFATRLSNGLCADLCCHLGVDSEFSKTQAAQANIKSVMFHPSHAKDKSENVMFDPGGQPLRKFTELNIDELQFVREVMLNFNEHRKEVSAIRSNEEKGNWQDFKVYDLKAAKFSASNYYMRAICFDPGGQLLRGFESFLKEFSLAGASFGFSPQLLIWNWISLPRVLSKLAADDRLDQIRLLNSEQKSFEPHVTATMTDQILVFMKNSKASRCTSLSFALCLVIGLAIEGFRSHSCSMLIEIADFCEVIEL